MSWVTLDEKICQSWVYPGGEVGVRAVGEAPQSILARVQSSDDLLRLVMYLNAVPVQQRVLIPYLPYARQDRVATIGDPNAIAAFAGLLGTTGAFEFETIDVHSVASVEVFGRLNLRLHSQNPLPYIKQYLGRLGIDRSRPVWFVSPDKGASEKVGGYARECLRGVIRCSKVRDPETGKLSGFRVEDGSGPKPDDGSVLVLVDDICDGGRTFLGVAAAVASHFNYHFERHLFTTHGIYSQGLQPLLSEFRTIGSTNSFLHGLQDERLITIPIEGTV